MGGVPTTSNQTAASFDLVIHELVYDVAVEALIAYSIAQVPFLGLPLIKQLFGFLVKKMASYFYVFLSNVATFQIIDLQVESEKKRFDEAVVELQKVHEGEDEEAKSKAIAEFKASLANLIHWDGSHEHQ